WPTPAEGHQESREAPLQPHMALHLGTTDLPLWTATITLLKFRETPQIGWSTKQHKHIGIRKAKAAVIEQEEGEECQRNGNKQRQSPIQTQMALRIEDVLVSITGRI
ncbi:hypothetical protein IL306_007912, partial [Fusarium sp. DS 682]